MKMETCHMAEHYREKSIPVCLNEVLVYIYESS